jgi:hypothetical protein
LQSKDSNRVEEYGPPDSAPLPAVLLYSNTERKLLRAPKREDSPGMTGRWKGGAGNRFGENLSFDKETKSGTESLTS